MNTNIRPDILTSTGRYFDYTNGQNVITVQEVAYALANICRFGGHCRPFYSVAEHSIRVSEIVPLQDAMWGLLHDAAEAYLGDVPRPLKNLLPDYRKIEKRIEAEILPKLGLKGPKPDSVKHADVVMLATEQRDLMPAHDDQWALIEGIDPLPDRIVPMTPYWACMKFMDRYHEINRQLQEQGMEEYACHLT